ncbi:hypothetical protein E2C01_037770 [Portunus trituberculatus]|uniref:Uncharacterized protein n=1 Tax=Portunus trituberculatus TaxID=210409 RepID=A0A5B7FFG9_PORTR|nr:hypothetical protein [Portunus trituberculatus]
MERLTTSSPTPRCLTDNTLYGTHTRLQQQNTTKAETDLSKKNQLVKAETELDNMNQQVKSLKPISHTAQ